MHLSTDIQAPTCKTPSFSSELFSLTNIKRENVFKYKNILPKNKDLPNGFFYTSNYNGLRFLCGMKGLKPLNFIIENYLTENLKIFAIQEETEGNKPNGYSYSIINEEDVEMLLTLPKVQTKNKNIAIYEVLVNYPKKLYFDFDGKNALNNKEFKENIDNIKKELLNDFPDANFSISGSNEPNNDDTKWSLHVIINNYIMQNENEMNAIKNYVQNKKKNGMQIDTGVYTKNRLMKCIGFKKKIGRKVQAIIEDKNLKNHMINSYFSGNYFNIPKKLYELNDLKKITNSFIVADFEFLKNCKVQELPTNFNIENLKYAEHYFHLLPIIRTYTHSFTAKICYFCVSHFINFNTFWEWAKHKNDSDKRKTKYKNKYEDYLKKIENGEMEPMSLKTFINFIKQIYPDLNHINDETNPKDAYTIKFLKGFDWETVEPKKIERLQQEHFFNENKCTLFGLSMGMGKTTQTLIYLKNIFDDIKQNITHNNELNDKIIRLDWQIEDHNKIKKFETECSVEMISRLYWNYWKFNHKYLTGNGRWTKTGYKKIDDVKSECNILKNQLKKIKVINVVWVVPLQSLVHNMVGRFKQFGLKFVNYMEEKNAINVRLNDTINILLICSCSLHLMSSNTIKTTNILVIDEIETVWHGFMQDNTHKHNMLKNWTNLEDLCINSDKIFMMDAFLTASTRIFLNNLKINYDLLENKHKPIERHLIESECFDVLLEKICEDILAGHRIFIYYPYINNKTGKNPHFGMEEFKKKILETVGMDKKILLYNGQSSSQHKKKLANCNDRWANVSAVIVNNAITVGVNYDNMNKKFYREYGFLSSMTLPRDFMQSSMRCREIETNEIYFYKFPDSGVNRLKKPFIYEQNENYRRVFDTVKAEIYANYKCSLSVFCEKANYKLILLHKNKKNNNNNNKNNFDNLVNIAVNYDKIDEINDKTAQYIKRNIKKNDYTCRDRWEYDKWLYNKKLNGVSYKIRKDIWDNNFINIYYNALKNMNLINEIIRENKKEKITELNLNRIIVNNDILDKINKKIDFCYNKPDKVAIEYLKMIFSSHIVSYKISRRPRHEWHELYKNYLNICLPKMDANRNAYKEMKKNEYIEKIKNEIKNNPQNDLTKNFNEEKEHKLNFFQKHLYNI
jgi:hypothetical protein